LFDPGQQSSSANQLTASKAYGRNGRATAHATGYRFADVSLGAMKKLGNLSERQKIEIRQTIWRHKFN